MKPDSLKPPEALCGQITFICTGLELSHPEHFQIKGALDFVDVRKGLSA